MYRGHQGGGGFIGTPQSKQTVRLPLVKMAELHSLLIEVKFAISSENDGTLETDDSLLGRIGRLLEAISNGSAFLAQEVTLQEGMALRFAPGLPDRVDLEDEAERNRKEREREVNTLTRERDEAIARCKDLEAQLLRRKTVLAEAAERRKLFGWQPIKQLNGIGTGIGKILGLHRTKQPNASSTEEHEHDSADMEGLPPVVEMEHGEAGAGADDLERQLRDFASRYDALAKRAQFLEAQVDPLRKKNDQLVQVT
jgi:hypothetical protein